MFKVILLFCLTAAVFAQHEENKHYIVDYYAQPEYKFAYSVHDPHTHDEKKQEEFRKGKLTKGFYTLKEADGKNERKVHYTIESEYKKHY